ncbi:hypothetical protein I4U23_016006 [Adineta vaga]|nr:hypothetical protein I4U23_016006 [Adineta vaga]
MSGQFDFRALLIKVQDLLSDRDRVRLHFLLGDDIPRNLRDNSSLSGTLSVLESLFDKDMISDQDCDYLIEAFKKIHCYDAAKRLQEYQRAHTQRNGRNCSLQDILIDDNEDDRIIVTVDGNNLNCPNQQFIDESLEKVHIPGTAIVVVNATHILYQHVFGYQSLLPKRPMNIDKSIFPLASISKTFIAVAVMQLVEKELVDLDTDINQYLLEPYKRIYHPQYPFHAITLRKLLSHSASIAINSTEQNTQYRPGDTAFEETLAEFCFKYINPNTSNWLPKPPGSVASYSNEGSSMAALVVERIANISYIQYVKERILKPLGVDVSKVGVRLADFENTEDFVKHYVYVFNTSYLEGWQKEIPQLNFTPISDNLPNWLHVSNFGFGSFPAGLLRMSAKALSIYLRMFMNNGSSIVHPRSITEMRTIVGSGNIPMYNINQNNHSTQQQSASQFGLSWYWQTMDDGRRYLGHSGSMLGIAHLMLFVIVSWI